MNDYNPQKIQNFFSYIERINAKRGELINETINLEAIIDQSIATHFCSDKKLTIELIKVIIRKLNFSTKINIFLKLIKTHYNGLDKDYPSMKKHFKIIIDMRNELAHSFIYANPDSANKSLFKNQFEFMDGYSEIRIIAETDIQRAIYLAKQYINAFRFRALAQSSAT